MDLWFICDFSLMSDALLRFRVCSHVEETQLRSFHRLYRVRIKHLSFHVWSAVVCGRHQKTPLWPCVCACMRARARERRRQDFVACTSICSASFHRTAVDTGSRLLGYRTTSTTQRCKGGSVQSVFHWSVCLERGAQLSTQRNRCLPFFSSFALLPQW